MVLIHLGHSPAVPLVYLLIFVERFVEMELFCRLVSCFCLATLFNVDSLHLWDEDFVCSIVPSKLFAVVDCAVLA